MGSQGSSAAIKGKVVFVLGASGTGKSKLAISLAIQFGGEIINSDKMQVYDGLNIITNKVTDTELAAVPHHLIGGIHPDADYSPSDFRTDAIQAVESIIQRGNIPIIAGGSNRYIEKLVEGEGGVFRHNYECCFLWMDVEKKVLHEFVEERVDSMVEYGLVEEARRFFDPNGNYTKGVKRSIGIPEMDSFFRAEVGAGDEEMAQLLEVAIKEIKKNTCALTCCQWAKIERLRSVVGWDMKRIDATEVFQRRKEVAAREQIWEEVVVKPVVKIVEKFLLSTQIKSPAVPDGGENCSECFSVAESGWGQNGDLGGGGGEASHQDW